MSTHAIVSTVERQDFVERAADPVQHSVQRVLAGVPVVRDALRGKWLGHSLHAALTDVPVGAWTAAFVLDAMDGPGLKRRFRPGADVALEVGLVGAFAAALTGLADWSATQGGAKKVGFVHAATNLVVAGLYTASFLERRRFRGSRRAGRALSNVGFGLVCLSAWLGRELVYEYGANVKTMSLAGSRRETIDGHEATPPPPH